MQNKKLRISNPPKKPTDSTLKLLRCHYLRADVVGQVFLGRFTDCSLNWVWDDPCNWSILALCTRSFVVSESSCQREVPPTVRAGVRLFSCVNPGVPPKLSRSYKRLIALCAAVRFFSRVSPHVCRQSPLLRKCLPTVRAVVGRNASVETLVSHKCTWQGEPLVTERALVGPLSSVSPLMVSQLSCWVTALVTVRTRKLLPRKARNNLRVHRL